MDLLQTKKDQIVNGKGEVVRWRGTCVDGWMNMENFINGYPGAENTLRKTMAAELGEDKAKFFFNRLLDNFFAEEDVVFLKSCGASVVRLPINYRHFESDLDPFSYHDEGFERLGRAIDTCAKHGLYVIIDLHSVQGWQSPDWHCDNTSRHALFWQHKQFQDRFIALWEELARRFRDNPAVAAYNVMNEPVSNSMEGRSTGNYQPDWDKLNAVNQRVVSAIRRIDPKHIIVLEGDLFSSLFTGLEPPFADNLVYSSHHYLPPMTSPGPYPGTFGGSEWNPKEIQRAIEEHEGVQFARKHEVPLWAGEFGIALYKMPSGEAAGRYRAIDDEIAAFEALGIHWTNWNYKDIGVMGMMFVDAESEYVRLIQGEMDLKDELGTDLWMSWLPDSPVKAALRNLAAAIEKSIGTRGINLGMNARNLRQAALSGYAGRLIQSSFARCFKDMPEARLDELLQAFKFANCKPNQGLVEVMTKHMR